MLSPLVIIGGLGALLLLLKKGSSSGVGSKALPTTGPTGKKWLIELVGKSGTVGSYLVYEPANPPVHDQYPVIQFAQLGDGQVRQLVSRFPSVPSGIYSQAMKDFGVQETF